MPQILLALINGSSSKQLPEELYQLTVNSIIKIKIIIDKKYMVGKII
jgi:hypothetical protein